MLEHWVRERGGRGYKGQIKTFRCVEVYNFLKCGDGAWVYMYVRTYQLGLLKYMHFVYVNYTSVTFF